MSGEYCRCFVATVTLRENELNKMFNDKSGTEYFFVLVRFI